jgi:hypothetical protein
MAHEIYIYRDNAANSVIFKGTPVGAHFTNSMHAVGDADTDQITIYSLTDIDPWVEITNLPWAEVLDINGDPAGVDLDTTVNYLNEQFAPYAGGVSGVPVITSSLMESVSENTMFRYQITATNAPFYWNATGLPAGLNVNNNTGFIFGVTTVVGVHPVLLTAVNAYGVGTNTLSLTVLAGGAWSDTYSCRFLGSYYKGYISVATTAAIKRTSAQAWSVSQWVYINATGNHDLYAYGRTNNYIHIQTTSTGQVRVKFYNGTTLDLTTAAATLAAATWYHIVVTNSGAETPAAVKVYVDGVSKALTTVTDDFVGPAPNVAPPASAMNIGSDERSNNRSLWLNGHIDEWSYWDTELTAGNVTTLYNAGAPSDIALVAFVANLKAWFRMGDGDTYPTLTDNAAGALHDGTMKNMTAVNFVNFTP